MIVLPTLLAGKAKPGGVSADSATDLQGLRRNAAIASVLAAMALVVLAAAITNAALPSIARSLQLTPAVSVRVITAYQLALAIALLPCAALGESFGYRRAFTVGVALFTGASLLCALARSLFWLVAARFLQGLGGAAVMALAVALLRFIVPHEKLAAAIGWNALTVALSSAAGPTLGALILSRASWPWLFAINLPVGAAVLLATRALPKLAGSTNKLEHPIFPFDLLRASSLRISLVASLACFAGQAAALVALPFYLQHDLGLSALMAGLMITPWPLSVAIAAPIAGRLAELVSTGWLCAVGALCLALGLGATALWLPLPGEAHQLLPLLVLCGVGFGLFQVPNNRNMLLAVPRARSGAAGAVQGTARLLGQTMGALATGSLFTLTSTALAPRFGLGLGALLTLTAALVSTLRVAHPPTFAGVNESADEEPTHS